MEADSPPTLATDTVQLLDSTIAQQITDFLNSATGTPQELESQFLASVLGEKLKKADKIGSIEAMKTKLLVYLQANNLDGAFRLLNGSHQPVENEFKGKYNPLKRVLNKMQAYVQEQPIHEGLPPELATFEAFEQHVKNLRRQVGLCLGVVKPKKGGALLIPKTTETIVEAMEATTQKLQVITNETAALAWLTPEGLLEAAIKHHVQESPDSADMLKIAWLQDLLEQVKNKIDGQGNSLLKNPPVQQHLQGVLLALGGGNSKAEQLALKDTIAQLAPRKASNLAPVPKSIVDGVGDLVTNAHAISRVNMGLSEDLLAQLPPEFQSPVALQTARETFQQGLLTGSQKVLDFAKSQLEPDAAEGLIQAYRLWLGQQAGQLAERLVQLENLPIVELPAILKKLPEVQQLQLQAFIVNASTLPPVEQLKQLKAVMADIPKDMRTGVKQFIDSEQQRLANMRTVEANAQQQLAWQVEKVVGGVQEVFNPAEISRQVNDFTTEMLPALQVEVVAPVAQFSEVITSIPARVQSGVEAVKAQILAELNTRILDPVKSKADQVTEVINKTTGSIGEAVQSAVGNTAKTGNGATTPVVVDKLPLPVSDGITFAKPLKVVEAQAEKVGWFPALMEQNKAWLSWAIGGTVGLGLLAWLGSWLSKRGKSVGEGEVK